MVSDGFVQVPHALLESLSSAALRLWITVRKSTGERLDPCWAAQKTLDTWMRCGKTARHVSSGIRSAQRELEREGLFVVKRRGPGQSAFRWALWPGTKGDAELRRLFDRNQIPERLHRSVRARRDASVLSGGPREDAMTPREGVQRSRLSGRQRPAKQNPLNRNLETGCVPSRKTTMRGSREPLDIETVIDAKSGRLRPK